MHRRHIDALLAVIPNLEHATFNNERLTIGGGEFTPETALALKLAAQAMLIAQRDHGSEADRMYLTPKLNA